MALVQTPQYFTNVPADDPLGSQAPLFYGPIQQGKDGWNAAFFCGSNAILRREALMQLGLVGYVKETEKSIRRALAASRSAIKQGPEIRGRRTLPLVAEVLDEVEAATRKPRSSWRPASPERDHLPGPPPRGRRRADPGPGRHRPPCRQTSKRSPPWNWRTWATPAFPWWPTTPSQRMSARDWSPLGALESVQAVLDALNVERNDEAQPVMPLATISVTEDMATAMRMHAMGWESVYHHEILAYGLAPEDLKTMLTQRLRWAQGTIQVLLRENPLVQKGLKIGQRLMYFATMWTYLSGYAAIIYFAAPIIYLLLGILPVTSLSWDFFIRFIPFMVGQPAAVRRGRPGHPHLARPAVQPGAVPHLDQGVFDGGPERLVRPSPRVCRHPEGPPDRRSQLEPDPAPDRGVRAAGGGRRRRDHPPRHRTGRAAWHPGERGLGYF